MTDTFWKAAIKSAQKDSNLFQERFVTFKKWCYNSENIDHNFLNAFRNLYNWHATRAIYLEVLRENENSAREAWADYLEMAAEAKTY